MTKADSNAKSDLTTLLQARRGFSLDRLRQLGHELKDPLDSLELSGLCVYATGSFARQEASKFSDIDLFFVHEGSSSDRQVSNLSSMRLFARVIGIGEKMGFPTFSNDGEYLRILYTQDILGDLGGPKDDYQNFFTARMLLLLESYPLANAHVFERVITETVKAYFRDYPEHAKDFRPVFLINDIIRFWKTLCLNYEHKRNRPSDDPQAKRKQQVKNFKLKFSRLLTCFGTIAAICAMPAPIDPESIHDLTRIPPLDRLTNAARDDPELTKTLESALSDYSWFLNLTKLETNELEERFSRSSRRQVLFNRGDQFCQKIHTIVDHLAKANGYRRFLVM